MRCWSRRPPLEPETDGGHGSQRPASSGAYEILHCETPPRVAIDEAVELAKRFGSAQSAQFVNGILDKLMHNAEANDAGKAASGQKTELAED